MAEEIRADGRWTLRRRVVVYLVTVHLLLAAVTARVLWEDPGWLFVLEALLAVSVIAGVVLARVVLVPLEIVSTGAELIKAQDFGSRFRPVGQPEVDCLVEVYNTMIDRLRDERRRVREKNELLDRLIDASPAGVILCDLAGQATDLNPAAERILGMPAPAVVGRSLATAVLPVLRELAAVGEGESQLLTLGDGRRLRARHASFRDRGFGRSFYLLEELTEELRRSERAAYGKVIRLISHEVNNTVAAVGSLLGALGGRQASARRESVERPENVERALQIASDRLTSLAAFVKRFTALVRLPDPDRRPCDVEVLLTDILQLLAPSFAERGIRVVRERVAPLPDVALDKNQIEQVLVNVLKNAAEAIETDGVIAVRSGVECDLGWVEVVDSGPGIPDEARGQLLTPFFTTKEQGCGLGLTLVAEILGRHAFPFSLEPAPGGGARFRLLLGA